MSNYFTMSYYIIVGVAVLAFAYHSGYHSSYKIVGVAVLATPAITATPTI